jgi:3-oxo-5-alpha-steroid 4-dehydrogenase 1
MPISLDTYRLITYAWIGIAVIIFFVLLRITAPYGRHSSGKWGPQIDNHLGWFFMEFPALLVMSYVLISNFSTSSITAGIMVGLYCLHYFNRSFIFPFRIHTKGKKMPILIMSSGIFFNLCNTFLLGYYYTNFAEYEKNWFIDVRFISGILLFFAGMWINWKADNILINLRKPGETGYKIPKGWLFNLISCPNLFGELIEWAGFAILCWNLPALAFFIWTAANLIPRALSHHKWYISHFSDYPRERKAIIPFLR